MKVQELARKNLEMSIFLDCFCNIEHCNNPVQTILILDCEEWQLCGAHYSSFLNAVRDLPKRDTAERKRLRSGPEGSDCKSWLD
jgi:hypothetical protein